MDATGERFERRSRYLGISLERGTDAVPRDGRYHVLHGNEVRYSSSNKTLAEAHFELLREELSAAHPELSDPKYILAREQSFHDILNVRGAARERARTQQEAKGGKGGRSGV
jgi:hypothetical protein